MSTGRVLSVWRMPLSLAPFRSSTDGTGPTHAMEGTLLFSKNIDFFFFKKMLVSSKKPPSQKDPA